MEKLLVYADFARPLGTYLWEHFCHVLAKQAGIKSASTKVIATSDKYHTLLSQRFDRTEKRKRIHFASAMKLLGLFLLLII